MYNQLRQIVQGFLYLPKHDRFRVQVVSQGFHNKPIGHHMLCWALKEIGMD